MNSATIAYSRSEEHVLQNIYLTPYYNLKMSHCKV